MYDDCSVLVWRRRWWGHSANGVTPWPKNDPWPSLAHSWCALRMVSKKIFWWEVKNFCCARLHTWANSLGHTVWAFYQPWSPFFRSYVPYQKQSWVYSGVALIPFQVYSRSGVDPDCSTPWSRIYAARLIPFHWSRGVSFYSGLLQSLNFSRQKVSDFFHP